MKTTLQMKFEGKIGNFRLYRIHVKYTVHPENYARMTHIFLGFFNCSKTSETTRKNRGMELHESTKYWDNFHNKM